MCERASSEREKGRTVLVSLDREQRDRVWTLLAMRHGRSVLTYLREHPGDAVDIDELAERLARESDASRDRIRIDLHHNQLPRLDDAGAISYDARSNTVRYWPSSPVARGVDAVLEATE